VFSRSVTAQWGGRGGWGIAVAVAFAVGSILQLQYFSSTIGAVLVVR